MNGGYFPSVWYPSAIGLLLLLGICLIGGLPARPASAWATRAVGALALLVGLSFASILWAGWRGAALESANELLLLLVAAWLVSILPWGPRSAGILMAAWSLGVAVICLTAMVRALGAGSLGGFIIENRFTSPLGYPNAEASLAVMAFWPSVILASARRCPLGLQALFLGACAFLLEFGLLPQSRGAIVVFPLALLVLLAFSQSRLRLLLRLAVIAPAVALTARPITAVYSASVDGRRIGPYLETAARGMLVSALAVAAAAILIGLAERRIRLGARAIRAIGRTLAAVTALAALGGAVTAAVEAPAIAHFAENRWAVFKSTRDTPDQPGLRLGTAYADQRYDYWRVALDSFASHPILGDGAGNFERVYTAERRVRFYSRFAHDVWLRFLSDLGVLGLALFCALVAALGAGLVMAARRTTGLARELTAASAATAGFFLLGSSFDWFDEMPALAAPALALPLIALAIAGPAPRARAVRRIGVRPRRWRIALTAAIGLAGLAALTLPYLSTRYVDRAGAVWPRSPEQAYLDLARARSLNPLSASPDLAEGTIALQLHDAARARGAFVRAISLQDSWYPHLEVALLDAQRGQFRQADAGLARAARLDASDPIIVKARVLLNTRQRLDPLAFNAQILDQTVYKTTR